MPDEMTDTVRVILNKHWRPHVSNAGEAVNVYLRVAPSSLAEIQLLILEFTIL